MGSAGDCVHDALAKESGLSIKSITYDSGADSIDVTAKYDFISVTVKLTKSARAGLLGATHNVETAAERDQMFEEFVAAHGRTYTAAERSARRAIFEENLELMTQRNVDGELGIRAPRAALAPEGARPTHH
eukprot:4436396-Prymnesium_polylepis.1